MLCSIYATGPYELVCELERRVLVILYNELKKQNLCKLHEIVQVFFDYILINEELDNDCQCASCRNDRSEHT